MNDGQIRNSQFVFREVNARIAEITITQGEHTSGFICERGRSDCTSILDLSLQDYQALRESGDFFIAERGHCVEGVDRLVESREGVDVLAQI